MIVHIKIGKTSWCQFDGAICAKLQEMAHAEKGTFQEKISLYCSYGSAEDGQKAVDFINKRLHWFGVEEKARVVEDGCDQRDNEEYE